MRERKLFVYMQALVCLHNGSSCAVSTILELRVFYRLRD